MSTIICCCVYREARAGECLKALFRNSRELTVKEIQNLVAAYGDANWSIGPELLGYNYPSAIAILNKADDKREQKKKD